MKKIQRKYFNLYLFSTTVVVTFLYLGLLLYLPCPASLFFVYFIIIFVSLLLSLIHLSENGVVCTAKTEWSVYMHTQTKAYQDYKTATILSITVHKHNIILKLHRESKKQDT